MSNVVKFISAKDQEKNLSTQSLDELQQELIRQIGANNISSILCVAYLKDEPEDITLYRAGDYVKERELLGDLKFLEAAILDGDI